MFLRRIKLAAVIAISLQGCQLSSPSCSDSKYTNVVKQIALERWQASIKQTEALRILMPSDEAAKLLGEKLKSDPAFEIINIRTTKKDTNLNIVECAADITVKVSDITANKAVPFTYRAEDTSDGLPYVTAWGL